MNPNYITLNLYPPQRPERALNWAYGINVGQNTFLLGYIENPVKNQKFLMGKVKKAYNYVLAGQPADWLTNPKYKKLR